MSSSIAVYLFCFFLDNGLSGNLRLTKELAGLRDPLVPDPPILELQGRACLALPLWVHTQ